LIAPGCSSKIPSKTRIDNIYQRSMKNECTSRRDDGTTF
jgi:hypothetical protein